MAEGVSANGSPINLEDNTPSLDSLPPPEYPSYSERSTGGNDDPTSTNSEVPNVEVHGRPMAVHDQTTTTPLTAEEMQVVTEQVKREEAKKYFSLREGQFTNAIENECKGIVNLEEDGKIISSYLLTEIDHWDHEKERIVMITEKKLVMIKYNFIGLRVDDHRKIPLISCDKIQSGRFTYPKNTMMIPRHFQTGLRIFMNKNAIPTFMQNWNPWSKEMPFITFAWHKALAYRDGTPPYMDLNGFQRDLVSAITSAHNDLHPGVAEESLEFCSYPILIQVYCGASPMFHNWSILGFNRDRGSFGY